jgi:hypothetical protein
VPGQLTASRVRSRGPPTSGGRQAAASAGKSSRKDSVPCRCSRVSEHSERSSDTRSAGLGVATSSCAGGGASRRSQA